MRYKTISSESFEFNTDNLSFSNVEDIILQHYGLGHADSSNFMELPVGRSSSHIIDATNGIIEFNTLVNEMNDGLYFVICYPKSVKKKM